MPVVHSVSFGYNDVDQWLRVALGIPESLIRYSTGIEDTDDLITDLEQALAKM